MKTQATKKLFGIIIVLCAVSLLCPPLVMANPVDNTQKSPTVPVDNTQRPVTKVVPSLENPIKAKNVQELLYLIADLAIFIGVILAILAFIFIGFKFVLAQGDPGALKEARQWFLWAVIGTAILIGSKVIVDIIRNTAVTAGVVNEEFFKR